MNAFHVRRMLIVVLLLVFAGAVFGFVQTPASRQQLTRDIYRELIEINTVTATGDTDRAARAMAARLRAAGFAAADVQTFTPARRKGNLVARLRGNGSRRPILLLAHLDVVEAKREDWSSDPFMLLEKDGYFYGRGTGDDKFMAAVFVANLIRYKQEGFVPARDIILALETDEEIADENSMGIQWLIKNHRDLIDAEFALNEGGNVGMRKDKVLRNSLQTSEKVYVDFRLEVENSGGHSSVPSKDNAIYHLAEGLSRLAKFDFPLALNETTRAWLEKAGPLEDAQTAADMKSVASAMPSPASVARLSSVPAYNAQLRTTCVATMLDGGHAVNALPQSASANVNCRVLPGESIDAVQKTLVQVLADPSIRVTMKSTPVPSPASPLNPEIVRAVERLTAEYWPGIPVVPTMGAGATDGAFLRNAGIPTYGQSGLAGDIDDNRAHGKDERVSIKAFDQGQEYLYWLVRTLSSAK